MLEGAADDLTAELPIDADPVKVSRFPASVNGQLDELQRYAEKLDQSIENEKARGDSALSEFAEILTSIDLTALKYALQTYATAASGPGDFVRLFENCMTLLDSNFQVEKLEDKNLFLVHLNIFTDYIRKVRDSVKLSEPSCIDQVPKEMQDQLDLLKQKNKQMKQKLRQLQSKKSGPDLVYISPVDPARTTSDSFNRWIWDTFSMSRKCNDVVQRKELGNLVGKAGYRLTKIKTLQEQITALRNLTDNVTQIECTPSEIEGSPFYQELKNYGIFLSRILIEEKGSKLPETCNALQAKLQDATKKISEKRSEMNSAFQKWQSEAITHIGSCDLELKALRTEMAPIFDSILGDYSWPDCETPTELEQTTDEASRCNNSEFRLITQAKHLWEKFSSKSKKVKQILQKCVVVQKQICALSLDESRPVCSAAQASTEMERLTRHGQALTAMLEALQESPDSDEKSVISLYEQAKASFDQSAAAREKLEAVFTKLQPKAKEDQQEKIATLDAKILEMRKVLSDLDTEIVNAELELAELEEGQAGRRVCEDSNHIFID